MVYRGLGAGLGRNERRGGVARSQLMIALIGSTVLGSAVAASVSVPAAVAQEAGATVRFSIPAQSLSSAVDAFSRATGWQVGYSSRIARSTTTRAVSGTMSPAQALQTMLAGTNVRIRVTGPTSAALIDVSELTDTGAAADGSTVLEAINVQGNGITTEGTGSYTTGEMSTATGLALSIKDTPQSVSVVTSARIHDDGMKTVEDALSRTTGIGVSATGGERSNYYARGFSVDNLMVDGLPISHDSDTVGSATLAMYDHIEVVRGATGLREGAGNPSASINFVRKRPTDTQQIFVSGSVGSWTDYTGVLDAGGPLNEAGTLRGRMVTSLQDANTFTQDYEHKRQLYYGILEADLTEATTVTLGGYYNKEDNPGADWNGLPTRPDGSFYDFDSSVRSSPSWTYWNKQNINVFGEIRHEFENDWVLNLKGSYVDAQMDMLGASLYRLDPTKDVLEYNVGKYHYHHKQTALDANLQGSFDLFGRTHELSVGANYRRNNNDDGPGGWPASFPYQFDPFNWQTSIDVPMPDFDYLWERQANNVNYGAYATAKFNIADPLNVFVGGRVSWYESESFFRSATYTESTALSANGKFTPYVAATYDLTDVFTAYGSVTSIFKPQDFSAAGGGVLPPEEGTNYEVGLKAETLDGRFNASFALFQIDQTNLPSQLPVSACGGAPECYANAGAVRSRGFEAEISGLITDNWQAFAGYTYVSSRFVKDSTSGLAGDPYGRDKPQHMVTLSTVYTLPGELENWRVGASARFQSKIEGNVRGYTNAQQGAYGLVDLMATYKPNERTEFKLNVYNLFDKSYYKSVGYTDNANILGAPRSFMLTGTYRF